jgi:hypothetical protein
MFSFIYELKTGIWNKIQIYLFVECPVNQPQSIHRFDPSIWVSQLLMGQPLMFLTGQANTEDEQIDRIARMCIQLDRDYRSDSVRLD